VRCLCGQVARSRSRHYRLCLRGPTGKIAKVIRFWANTDEGALATAREMLAEDPTMIGYDLWDGSRQVAEERRRAGVKRALPRQPQRKRK
jgi:hypothetical protein